MFDLYSFYLEPATDVNTFAPAMELGASFGAKYATVMGADTDWSRQRDNFITTCDLAKQFGLTCSLEFAVIRPLATLPQTVQLITESKRDAVICIDPLHLARSGGTPADVKALPAKYFPYAQISDGVLEPGEPNPALFGKLGTRPAQDAGRRHAAVARSARRAAEGHSAERRVAALARAAGTSASDWAKMTLQSVRRYLGQ